MRFTQHIKTEEEIKLDLKDKKILYWLSKNARIPATILAKKVSLSKDSIKYRINKLEKSGLIQGYTTRIDTDRLGFGTYHIFLQLNQLNKQIKDKLIEVFRSYDFLKVLIEFSGRYNFEISVIARNINELDARITRIIDDVSKYVQEYQLLIISKYYIAKIFPGKFIEIKDKDENIKSNTKLKVDKIDLEILNILSDNAILPLYKIGQLVKLSPDAINYRIKKLSEKELIMGYIPIVNYSLLGYTVYAVLMNIHNLSSGKENMLKEFLKTNDNVLWAVKTMGKYNLLMYVCVKKSDELHQTLIDLRYLFSSDIKDYETLIAYEEYVYTYFPKICRK